MRALAAAVLAGLALAGMADAVTSVSTGGASGLQGIVYRGPIRPVCEELMPCDLPAPGTTLVFSRSGNEVKRVTSGPSGRYLVRLAPGTYAVRTARKLGIGAFGPRNVRVPAGRIARVDFHIDTGIR